MQRRRVTHDQASAAGDCMAGRRRWARRRTATAVHVGGQCAGDGQRRTRSAAAHAPRPALPRCATLAAGAEPRPRPASDEPRPPAETPPGPSVARRRMQLRTRLIANVCRRQMPPRHSAASRRGRDSRVTRRLSRARDSRTWPSPRSPAPRDQAHAHPRRRRGARAAPPAQFNTAAPPAILQQRPPPPSAPPQRPGAGGRRARDLDGLEVPVQHGPVQRLPPPPLTPSPDPPRRRCVRCCAAAGRRRSARLHAALARRWSIETRSSNGGKQVFLQCRPGCRGPPPQASRPQRHPPHAAPGRVARAASCLAAHCLLPRRGVAAPRRRSWRRAPAPASASAPMTTRARRCFIGTLEDERHT